MIGGVTAECDMTIFTHTHAHPHTHTHTHEHAHTRTHTHTCTRTHAHTHTGSHTDMKPPNYETCAVTTTRQETEDPAAAVTANQANPSYI